MGYLKSRGDYCANNAKYLYLESLIFNICPILDTKLVASVSFYSEKVIKQLSLTSLITEHTIPGCWLRKASHSGNSNLLCLLLLAWGLTDFYKKWSVMNQQFYKFEVWNKALSYLHLFTPFLLTSHIFEKLNIPSLEFKIQFVQFIFMINL